MAFFFATPAAVVERVCSQNPAKKRCDGFFAYNYENHVANLADGKALPVRWV